MIFWSPIWRSANLWKSHNVTIPKRSPAELLGYYMSRFFWLFRGPFFSSTSTQTKNVWQLGEISFGRFFYTRQQLELEIYPTENEHDNWQSPFSIGDTSTQVVWNSPLPFVPFPFGIFSDPGFLGRGKRQKVSGWLGARWKWCGWQSRSWNSWRLLYHSQRTDRGAWKKDRWTFSQENVDVCEFFFPGNWLFVLIQTKGFSEI